MHRSLIWQVSPDLLGTVNSKGFFETTNPAWMTVLGWTETEVTSVSLFELIHPDDVERTREQSVLTQQGQPAILFRNRYRCKDGRYRWISWLGVLEDGVIFCSGRDITAEVDQAEQLALARRERDTAWAVSQDLLVAVGPDGTFKSVNAAWTARLGWTEGELLERMFTELTHPDDLEKALAVFANVSLAPLSTPFEHRLRHRDGSYRWFAWTAVLAGAMIYGNGRDTTAERENAAAMRADEDALRNSLAFMAGPGDVARALREANWSASPLGHPQQWPQSLRSVINLVLGSALPMFVAWGPQLIAIYNDAYAVLCGERHPAALGQPLLETWSEIRSVLESLVGRALAGESFLVENLPLCLRRNGFDEKTWFTFSYSPLVQEDGQIGGLYCSCIETTQAMLAQQKLLAREEWLQSLFHQAPGFAAVMRGPDHRFVMVNQAYSDLTGSHSLVGLKLAQAFPEAMEQGFGDLLDGVYASGQPYVGRGVKVRLGQNAGFAAREIIVDFMYQPLRDAHGRIEGIFVQGHDVTEQHRAQQALQAFSDSIPAIAWVATADGLLERFNAQWYDYTGTSHKQNVARGWVKWVHPDDVPAARAAWEGARGGNKAWQVEYRLRRQDGVYRWFLVRAVPQLDLSGAVQRWFGTTIDIEDTRQAQKELRLLASIVENSRDFIGIADTLGNPVYGNRAAMEFIGIKDLEQVRHSKIVDYFIPEQRQFVDEVVMPAVATDGRWSGELTMQHFVTGATFPVWYDLFRVDDHVTGQPANFATIARDLTESKRVEKALAERTELLNGVLEGTTDMVYVKDLNGRLLLANTACAALVGASTEQVVGKKGEDLLPPNLAATMRQHDEAVIAGGTPIQLDETFLVAGEARVFLTLKAPLRDSSNSVIGILGISRDITERKNIELHLIEATAAAEKANRAKSDFLSSMSHEMRTPLNSILGFAQLLEAGDPAPTPAQSQKLKHIVKSGWYLLELVNELLDLSHIESGKLLLTQDLVPLTEVLHECRDMIEYLARERKISITFPSVEVSGYARADRTRVKQVLINLLSNAIKYNKAQGAVTVEVALRPPDAICVSVRDTGEGLSSEQLAQLFQPFNRLGKEAGPEQGTGIGLVMCKRLIELMGGSIGADSEVGVGSVFWFELKWVSTAHDASA